MAYAGVSFAVSETESLGYRVAESTAVLQSPLVREVEPWLSSFGGGEPSTGR